MSTMSEADLQAHIRWQLETGALPFRAAQQKLYGGRGSGKPCSCCGRPVGTADVLYEVESADHALLTMHLRCFEAWEVQSSERSAAREQPPGSKRAF